MPYTTCVHTSSHWAAKSIFHTTKINARQAQSVHPSTSPISERLDYTDFRLIAIGSTPFHEIFGGHAVFLYSSFKFNECLFNGAAVTSMTNKSPVDHETERMRLSQRHNCRLISQRRHNSMGFPIIKCIICGYASSHNILVPDLVNDHQP